MLNDLLHVVSPKAKTVIPFPDIDHATTAIYNPQTRQEKLTASTALFKLPKISKQKAPGESRPSTSKTLIVLSSQSSSRPQTSKTLCSRPTTIGSSFTSEPSARARYRTHEQPSSPPPTSTLVDMKGLYPLQPLLIPMTADVAPAFQQPRLIDLPPKRISPPKLSPILPSPIFNRLDSRKTLDPPPSALALDSTTIAETTAQYVTFVHGQAQLNDELIVMLDRIVGEWVVLPYAIKNIESVLVRFQIPWAEIGCFQLVDLVSSPSWNGRITRSEVLEIICNDEAKKRLLNPKIKINYSENHYLRMRALKIIVPLLQGLVSKRKHNEFMKLVRAGRVVNRYWRILCRKKRFKQQFKLSQLYHFEKARNLENGLRLNWTWKYEKFPKFIIHLASDTLHGASAQNKVWQDLQVGRLLDLKDETTTVIYITRSYNDIEMLQLNSMVDNCFDSRKRLHIMVPKTAPFFPPGSSLAKMLYCCSKTMKEISKLVGAKAAFIVPGIVGDYDIRISSILGIPLCSPFVVLQEFYDSRSKERAFLEKCNIAIPFGQCISPCLEADVEFRITELMASHAHIQCWIVRINGKEKLEYLINKSETINEEIFRFVAKYGGAVQAIPPVKFRTVKINFELSPSMRFSLSGSADLLFTGADAKSPVGHIIPQQTLSGNTISELNSSIAASLVKIGVYSSVEYTIQVFYSSDGLRRIWVSDFSPYPTRTSAIIGFVMLASCGTVSDDGGFLYDNFISRRLNLRYINKIPHAVLDPLYDHSGTNDIYHGGPRDVEDRVALWVSGLDHSGWSEISLAIVNALFIDSGIVFDLKWRVGTILPVFEPKVSLVTIGTRVADAIETIMWCLMVINQRIGEYWTNSNFMDYAITLAAELRNQRDRIGVNHDPNKRLAANWQKDDTLDFGEMRIFEADTERGDLPDEESDELQESYEFEQDESDDDLPNEMKDDVSQSQDDLCELDKFLSQYTATPDYHALKLSWKVLGGENPHMISLLTTYQLTSRTIPSYQLRDMPDFGEEDVNDHLYVVPKRQRVVTGLGLEAYMEIMDFFVDSQIEQEEYELKQKRDREIQDIKDLDELREFKFKFVLKELLARHTDKKIDQLDSNLLSAKLKSNYVDPLENLMKKIGSAMDTIGMVDEAPDDEWTIKEEQEEEEEADEELNEAKQRARKVFGAFF